MLVNVACKVPPTDYFTLNNFFVELIYRPLTPYNITNWRVFNDYQQIIDVLHSEDTFKGYVINDEQHVDYLQTIALGDEFEKVNRIPRSIVRLEKLF